jgi:DNA-binding NtrC family response regulator
VEAKTFREDLYGRLMTFEIRLTSLAERPGDIDIILNHLGCEDLEDLSSSYWKKRLDLFNVRALQAYALRKKL